MKKIGKDRRKCVVYESSAIPISSERIHAFVERQYPSAKPSPRGEGGERSEPDRVLAV